MSRRQQREPVIEAVYQLRHPRRLHPRRGQRNRQRYPVSPATSRATVGPVSWSSTNLTIHLAGPVCNNVTASDPRPGRVTTARQGQRS